MAPQVLEQRVEFAFNDATVLPPARSALQALATALKADAKAWDHLEISGHGNSIGTEAHNLTVSWRRAHSVAAYLIGAGVPQNKLQLHAFGESAPLPGVPLDAARQRRVGLRIAAVISGGPLAAYIAAQSAIDKVPSP